MRYLRSTSFLVVMISFLAGCGPIYNTHYTYVPPKSPMGKMCISQCLQNKSNCEQMCQMRNENCRTQARQNAFYDYQNYKQDRRAAGKKVKKTISDFDQGSSCNAQCGCDATFNSCYSACGGQVLEQQVCVAFCDK